MSLCLAPVVERRTRFHVVDRNWSVVAAVIGLIIARFPPMGGQWGPLAYHSWQYFLVELLCFGIALSVFVVGWYADTKRQTIRGLAFSVIFLAVGLLNLLQLLSLPNMSDFITPNSVNKALMFSYTSRLVAAGCMLWVAFLPIRRIERVTRWCYLCGTGLSTILLSFCILKCETSLPPFHLEGQPQSRIRLLAATVTICLLLVAYVRIFSLWGASRNPIHIYTQNAVGMLMVGEIAFALDTQVGGVYGLLGHTYKAVAYGYIFQSLLISSLGRFNTRLIELQGKLRQTRRLRIARRQIPRLAHELKNPLSAIRASAQLSAILDDPVQRSQVTKRMETEVDRLSELITFALETSWSRPGTAWDVVDVREVIRELMALWAPEFSRVGIITGLEIEHGLPSIQAHSNLIQRALTNMVLNAVEAMPQGGELLIEACQDPSGKSITVTITDTGAGIPIEVREHLFNEFVTTKSKGTGLGLVITHQVITEFHRGRIWFETAVGMGTKFFVRLPITQLKEAGRHYPSLR